MTPSMLTGQAPHSLLSAPVSPPPRLCPFFLLLAEQTRGIHYPGNPAEECEPNGASRFFFLALPDSETVANIRPVITDDHCYYPDQHGSACKRCFLIILTILFPILKICFPQTQCFCKSNIIMYKFIVLLSLFHRNLQQRLKSHFYS